MYITEMQLDAFSPSASFEAVNRKTESALSVGALIYVNEQILGD